MPEHSQERPPEDQTLDAWLAELSGKSAAAPEDATARQARLIRQVVLAQQKSAEDAIPEADIRRGREQLQFRLARENLLTGRGGAGSRWLAQAPLAMAATVAVVAMGVFVTMSNLRQVAPVPGSTVIWSAGEIEVPRGSVETLKISTNSPAADARAIAERLATASIPFELSGTSDDSARLLKIQVAGQVIPSDLSSDLAARGIDLADQDVVYVEFSRRGVRR